MQSGELFVTGKDKVVISLKKFPSKVSVHFKDEPHVVPCNHHHHDELKWEVHASHHHYKSGFILVIEWNVTNVREIKWEASY